MILPPMKVAIVSDIHDKTNNLLSAVATAKELGCERMIFLGDMVHLQTFILLREEWDGPLDLVFGNNEYEWEGFYRYAAAVPDTTLHGEHGELELDGLRIFFTHLPSVAECACRCERYDIILYGHTHMAEIRRQGERLLANPGEVQGRSGQTTIGVLDTSDRTILLYPI